ncbi:ABC transporter permease [Vallitalea longa]|uniref:ABC transporter permease n=1 Tax=Vallitalea longa TaxID=2936439 RepID=A0A9W5Y7N0_9FIRM|nr:ABC transporter permease [Vallitalea longa]GKX27719.1 ABC transporter permease [Vallitalea longa]
MTKFILKRIFMACITIFIITFAVFVVIQLPPGDYVDTIVTNMIAEGETVTQDEVELLKEMYGVDKPILEQYFSWLTGIFKGDWGISFYYNQEVLSKIGEVLGNTLLLSFVTMLFTYLVSIPIAIYAAKHQYSIGDYIFTFIGFLGMAIPNFLFAIVLMFASYKWFGKPLMGLFPEGGITSWASFVDFLSHLIIPIIVIGTGGTCSLIRIVRAQMLDEQEKPYVLCTRAKGVSESTITYKYAMRSVLNPIVAGLGPMISNIFTGSTITAIVLMLPTQGPILLKALQSQDVYLSGGILLISATLVVLGTLLSDILLAVLDPRIKHMEESK